MDERRALLRLRLLPGVGDRTIDRLLSSGRSALEVMASPPDRFAELVGSRAEAARGSPELEERVVWILNRCEALGIDLVTRSDGVYPGPLLALSDPPPILFLRGRPALLRRRSVAIVGARRATAAGRRTAERLGRELAARGVTVVSGLALGIDGAAHRGALGGRGGTIAVLGCGPDRAYPRGNLGLFRRIVAEGLLVSEFPPGERVRPHHFPRRNRVLAGLARCVIVVEAGARSGALITVDHALDLGLDVFAVPGSIESDQARGTNALLRDGAHLLTRVEDVLEAMGWEDAEEPNEAGDLGYREAVGDGVKGEGDFPALLSALSTVPSSLETLMERVDLPPGELLATLTRLELDGHVRRENEGWRRCEEPPRERTRGWNLGDHGGIIGSGRGAARSEPSAIGDPEAR